jgi:hypothetical protein
MWFHSRLTSLDAVAAVNILHRGHTTGRERHRPLNIGNGTQYGWARIGTKLDSDDRARDIIKDYAWGDVGDAIRTGQTQSLQPAKANSVAGSLGLLAFGAQGLDAWRAQRTPESD